MRKMLMISMASSSGVTGKRMIAEIMQPDEDDESDVVCSPHAKKAATSTHLDSEINVDLAELLGYK